MGNVLVWRRAAGLAGVLWRLGWRLAARAGRWPSRAGGEPRLPGTPLMWVESDFTHGGGRLR
ncbi:MAG: hypothetical protein KatS3mg131_2270 [Candidatus Tectimicrobiota bacterium]|nr:MAG: hypothetical protein KatS3mg131_2270 [Candidatus Tectomicrobia bacterium]